ncbi:Gamma-butyrobetaine dioxygenase [Trichoplax sp. H2]|nr:Gamma-butyrobetaine dioxygenase [Trichoplax sp. H2]|eukprot:RDD36075.1 Gamma-butyrobetaine dioxygenase [Trichoplax sp. H2]
MLHCVTAAKQGGDSQFTDGFKAAEQLRASHPQYFKILAETPVEHEDTGTDSYEFSLTAEHPIIRLNENGDLKQIYYGDHTRTSRIDVPHYKLTDFYNAMTQFLRYAYSPANIIQFKLQPGTLISVDNFRVLHGRTAFVVSPDNFRHVEGGHVDWDGATSCMRVLEKELNIDYRTPNI